MLEELQELSRRFLKIKDFPYRRYLIRQTSFKQRLSVIVGQRGVGKTTTLVQALLDRVDGDRKSKKILYIQADHFLVGSASLYEIAERYEVILSLHKLDYPTADNHPVSYLGYLSCLLQGRYPEANAEWLGGYPPHSSHKCRKIRR